MSDNKANPATATSEEKAEKVQRPNQKRRRHNRTKNKNRAPQNVGPFGVGGPKAEPTEKPQPQKGRRGGRKPAAEESKDGQPAHWTRKERRVKLLPKKQWVPNKAIYNVGAEPAAGVGAPAESAVASGTCLERALALNPVALLLDPAAAFVAAEFPSANKEGQSAMAAPEPDARTENNALAYSSTGSWCLDLFFGGMLRGADEPKVLRLTAGAWQENPSRCLQVIMHARDCRGGKGEKEVVLTSMLWLRINKPRTYLRNIRKFLALGCHRDLVQLAYRAIRLGLAPLGRRDFIELEVLAEDLMADHTKLVAWQKAVEEAGATAASDEEKKPRKPKLELSLAAKWAPSEHASFDRKLSLAKRMAKLLFPGQEDAKKGYRTLLTPLRAQIKLVESSMCANEWQDIQFGKVPSRAHHKLKKAFIRHETERYKLYLEELKKGKEKINTRGLQPHEVVKTYLTADAIDETVEAQWRTMVANLQKEGVHLSHVLSMVDVSGSMSGIPMEVAIALGLITSEICGGAFHNQVLTFDSNPVFHTVVGDTLLARVKNLAAAPWGGSTNILAAFDRILEMAQKFNVPPAEMPSTLFIYSDMQFDQAREPAFQNHATHEIIKEKYRAAGYSLPHIVYWNLRPANTSVPTVNEQGVALLSGFSADLLKVFMTNGDFSPEAILTRAITHYAPEIDPSEV